MRANVVNVKRLLSEVATAPLTFAVGRDEKLTGLVGREETATVYAIPHSLVSGLHRIHT